MKDQVLRMQMLEEERKFIKEKIAWLEKEYIFALENLQAAREMLEDAREDVQIVRKDWLERGEDTDESFERGALEFERMEAEKAEAEENFIKRVVDFEIIVREWKKAIDKILKA